ncbi:hypothetical protein DFJ74DRAFT_725025 [Hyaloraphidium curvatum]|nr:hypothetical protein DFJ74DRAFT_725025 [Hyaloraphidium curvatum]
MWHARAASHVAQHLYHARAHFRLLLAASALLAALLFAVTVAGPAPACPGVATHLPREKYAIDVAWKAAPGFAGVSEPAGPLPWPRTVLVGVFSRAEDHAQRNVVRMAWTPLLRKYHRADMVDVLFVVCPPPSGGDAGPSPGAALVALEMAEHGDILVLQSCPKENMNEGKSVTFFGEVFARWRARVAREVPEDEVDGRLRTAWPYDFVMKADSDNFLHLPNLERLLSQSLPSQLLIDCGQRENCGPGRYERVYYGNFAGGTDYAFGMGYGLSWDLVVAIASYHANTSLIRGIMNEEIHMGRSVHEVAASLPPLPGFNYTMGDGIPAYVPGRGFNIFSDEVGLHDAPSAVGFVSRCWRCRTVLAHNVKRWEDMVRAAAFYLENEPPGAENHREGERYPLSPVGKQDGDFSTYRGYFGARGARRADDACRASRWDWDPAEPTREAYVAWENGGFRRMLRDPARAGE